MVADARKAIIQTATQHVMDYLVLQNELDAEEILAILTGGIVSVLSNAPTARQRTRGCAAVIAALEYSLAGTEH